MNKCHCLLWEGHDVGSTAGGSMLQCYASVKCLCSSSPKCTFISLNIYTKNLRSRSRHEKLVVDLQGIITYGS
jgi:hypothetical protein